MGNSKIIYILIGIFCFFAILAGIYAQFFVNDVNKPSIIVPGLNNEEINQTTEISQEELKAQFANLFKNDFNIGNYDISNIEKLNENKDIIYTAIHMDEKKNNYEMQIDLPVINVKGDVAASFNNITQTIFADKASEIINSQSNAKVIYSVSYQGFINGDILSLVIKSTLKDGNNPQRVIVQTYNYNLATNQKVEVTSILSQKNIILSECQKKINDVIKKANEETQILTQSGYPVFNRDLSSTMYLLSNLSTYFLGPNGDLYIIFAYGNQNFTSDMDIIWYE